MQPTHIDTMKISVKLIATYRQLLPEGTSGNRLDIEVPSGTQVKEVIERFNLPYDRESVILVNGHVPDPDQPLQEGDQVVAFPAMAGGHN